MHRLAQLRASFLSTLTLLLFASAASAHGGTYRGPGSVGPPTGDVVPGGAAGAPGAPGPSGGAPTPGAPAAPGNPSSASGFAPVATPSGAGGALGAPDLTVWNLWWNYNRDAYVDVRSAIHSSDVAFGTDRFFLGRRPKALARERLVPTQTVIREEIVPALFDVLENESDADMVTGALVALAKIGEASDGGNALAKRITSFLADNNQEIAETAAISLGILGANEADGVLDVLSALLHDRPAARRLLGDKVVPWRTRAFAAYGLGLVGNREQDGELRLRVVDTLVDAIESGALELPTPDVAVACITALGIVPLPSLVASAGAVSHRRIAGRQDQVRWLLAFGEREGLDDVVAAHVPTTIAKLVEGTPREWQLKEVVCWSWIRRLAKPVGVDRGLQHSLVLALGRLGDADADRLDLAIQKTLRHATEASRSVELRRFALVALAQAASRPGDADTEAPTLAEARAFLVERLDGRSADRTWVALALGVLGHGVLAGGGVPDERLDARLAKELSASRNPLEVGAFAIAIGMRQQVSAEKVLLEKLDEIRDDTARGTIALALGMSGATAALEPIERLVRRSKYRPELMRESAISLGLLGDKHVAEELIDMLAGASSLSAQASIAFGLGSIGDARSIAPLIELLRDEDETPRARAFAAVALGIVCDKDPRPWNAKLSAGINYRANTTTLTDGQGAGILEIL